MPQVCSYCRYPSDKITLSMSYRLNTTLFTFHFIVPVPIDLMLDVDVPLISEILEEEAQ